MLFWDMLLEESFRYAILKTTDGGASWIDKSSGFNYHDHCLLLNLLMLIQDLLVGELDIL